MTYLMFKYGTMNSSKTANLLMTAYTLRAQGKMVILMKPAADHRGGQQKITSRVGLTAVADIVLYPNNFPLDLRDEDPSKIPELKVLCEKYGKKITDGRTFLTTAVDMILVDEAQFLSVSNVEMLRKIASQSKFPIVCYGLLTDYRTKLFPGSKRLIELSDSIKEVTYDISPTLGDCCSCKTNKAIVNSKFITDTDGIKTIKEGSSLPDLGAEEKYKPLCWSCWEKS